MRIYTRIVISVAAGLIGFTHAEASPFLLTADSYSQNFEGLTWTSTSAATGDFGLASSNTEGWVATNVTQNPVANYYSRNSGRTAAELTLVGSSSLSTPVDRSVCRYNVTYAPYLSLFLKNGTGSTINEAQLSFSLKLWTTPSADVTDGVWARYDVGNYWTVDSTPLAGTTMKTAYKSGLIPRTTAVGTQWNPSMTLTNLGWDSGESLLLAWRFDTTAYSANQLIAIDDVLITVPEPTVMGPGLSVASAMLLRRQRQRAHHVTTGRA